MKKFLLFLILAFQCVTMNAENRVNLFNSSLTPTQTRVSINDSNLKTRASDSDDNWVSIGKGFWTDGYLIWTDTGEAATDSVLVEKSKMRPNVYRVWPFKDEGVYQGHIVVHCENSQMVYFEPFTITLQDQTLFFTQAVEEYDCSINNQYWYGQLSREEWFVNSAYWDGGSLHFTLQDTADPGHLRFQYNSMQLLCSGIMGVATGLYAMSLPVNPNNDTIRTTVKSSQVNIWEAIKKLVGIKGVALFLIFVIFSGVCLQISNGFVTPYITHFTAFPEYMGSLAAGNATMLFSLSQISEGVCILLVGLALKWKGIRFVYAIGLLAWATRFLMLGFGNPGDGLWLLIGSMLVYGIAFNFITIAGHLHIQQIAPKDMKGLAHGMMMFMSNGIGATTGILIAGAIVNHWCQWEMISVGDSTLRLFMGDWFFPWIIFAAYAFIISLLWTLTYRKPTP